MSPKTEAQVPLAPRLAALKIEPETASFSAPTFIDAAEEAANGCNCAPPRSTVASVATPPAIGGSAGSAERTDGLAKADALPWIVSSPAPAYPREARRKGWAGRVGVHVLISERGTVQQVELVSSSGHSELDESAIAALRDWLFHPAQKDGHAIAAWVVVPVLFRLDD